MSEKKYTEAEVFTLPWVLDKYGQWGFSLPRVAVKYKIRLYRERFHLWVRCQKNTPYKLGVFFTLAEAEFRVYDHILYFGIYEDGQWHHQSERKRI